MPLTLAVNTAELLSLLVKKVIKGAVGRNRVCAAAYMNVCVIGDGIESSLTLYY